MDKVKFTHTRKIHAGGGQNSGHKYSFIKIELEGGCCHLEATSITEREVNAY